MRLKALNGFIIRLVSLSLLSLGLAQTSSGGVIATEQLIQAEERGATITRIEATLAREDVASQLLSLGVDPQAVQSRVSGLSNIELLTMEGRLDQQIAGGDAVGIVGAVFIVLIILELMGVTDIFKSM